MALNPLNSSNLEQLVLKGLNKYRSVCHQSRSQLVSYADLAVFFPVVVVVVIDMATDETYPRTNGQAELAWVAWLRRHEKATKYRICEIEYVS